MSKRSSSRVTRPALQLLSYSGIHVVMAILPTDPRDSMSLRSETDCFRCLAKLENECFQLGSRCGDLYMRGQSGTFIKLQQRIKRGNA